MPKHRDYKNILIIGAGPIVIGQACEFDYSGTQACKALKELGYKVTLINSNPATIMTDPSMADKTYIEPITAETVRKIVVKEKVDAILPTVGGQTALNTVIQVAKGNFLRKHKVSVIGANLRSIEAAENRELFKKAMTELGYKTCLSQPVRSEEEAEELAGKIRFPTIIRPSFTLGGTGGSIAYNLEEFKSLVKKGLSSSMTSEVIVEESILGWKEFEYEVMKDLYDNVVIICTIENVEAVGVHTGDSVTVAPQQTLSDREYQKLRDMSIEIIKKIGVATGGANIQFAVHPESREVIVIEMNPRVSRSSALASKATGFPIAKIAAKLAVGCSLEDIPNDITKTTPSCFEPTIDYVVTKMPRFNFEKFASASQNLGIQMKSVGETMAIGRTFQESFQKAFCGLEKNSIGFEGVFFSPEQIQRLIKSKKLWKFFCRQNPQYLEEIRTNLRNRHHKTLRYVKDGFFYGLSVSELNKLSHIDEWFLHQLHSLVEIEKGVWRRTVAKPSRKPTKKELLFLKQHGFSDANLAILFGRSEAFVRSERHRQSLHPSFKMVDTCAGEFVAETPYYYSTYDEDSDLELASDKERIVILGSGPNRIGQGIEFDYMCVKAAQSVRKLGLSAVIINSNPETVSTDYDTSDMLFFDPLTFEHVYETLRLLKPKGVFIQFGGQTPLNLSEALSRFNVTILGTQSESIANAEDRNHFQKILKRLGIRQPANQIASSANEALHKIKSMDYPLLIRPSYVLGGRSMEVVYDDEDAKKVLLGDVGGRLNISPQKPLLIDRYLENAIELDVDAISDGKATLICGVMEHIEQAGIHSGDSGCVLPPQSISDPMLKAIQTQTNHIAKALKVKGFVNIQFAIKDDVLYCLEVNPRGSRTIPFVSKAMGVDWVEVATKVMLGASLRASFPSQDKSLWRLLKHVNVKQAMLPFDKFPEEDTILGPEMKSTGEAMGIGRDMGEAYYKAEASVYRQLPLKGGLLITIKSKEHNEAIESCVMLREVGFAIYATEGTSKFLSDHGVKNHFVHKMGEGRPNIRDKILDKKIHLIFNTPIGKTAKITDTYIRILAKQYKIPIITTIWGMKATAHAIMTKKQRQFFDVRSLQSLHKNFWKLLGQQPS